VRVGQLESSNALTALILFVVARAQGFPCGQVWGSRDLQGDSVEDRVSDLLTDLLAPLDIPPDHHRSDGLTCAPVPGIAATFIRFAADALGPGRTRTGEIPACRCDRMAQSLPFYALCD